MLLNQEMHSTLKYFEKRIGCIKAKIEELNQVVEQSCYSRGAICLLSKLLNKVTYQLTVAIGLFSEFIEIRSEQALPSCDAADLDVWTESSDESDTESDTESDSN